ncbi:MAG: TrmB family transcriptional regulator [Candidatus Aenigmatarchaeota archaeon]
MALADKLIHTLQELGLATNEAKVYITLLTIGASSATEISRSSGIPQPRIYDIMSRLEKKGFIEIIHYGKRRKYQAVNPELALNRLMEDYNSACDSFLKNLKKLQIEKAIEPSVVWVINGRSNIITKIAEMINNAKYEVILALDLEYLKRLKNEIIKNAKRGLNISIVSYSDIKNSDIEEILKYAYVKYRDIPSAIVCMSDYKAGLVRSYASDIDEHAIYSQDFQFNHVLDYYFYYSLWKPSSHIKQEIEFKQKRSFTYIWRIIEEINKFLKEGRKPKVLVQGKLVKNEEKIKLSGLAIDTKISEGKILSFILETKDGTKYTIGGRGAKIEDIEAYVSILEE